jgi:hypothetical protein
MEQHKDRLVKLQALSNMQFSGRVPISNVQTPTGIFSIQNVNPSQSLRSELMSKVDQFASNKGPNLSSKEC